MTRRKQKTSLLDTNVNIGGVTLMQKAVFAKNLSMMLKSGLTLHESLEITMDQSSGKLKKELKGVLSSVTSGQSLADSFARYPKIFSGMFVNITKAGEEAGTLEENLENIAIHIKKEAELYSKIKGALLYPIVVLVAAIFLGLAMSFLVLPKIIPLFEGLKVELPITTRMLIWFSHLIQDYGAYLFYGLIVFLSLAGWIIRQKFSHPVTHWLLLKLPIVKKIIKYTNLSRFSNTLATLLKGGLNIDKALVITQNTIGNFYYKETIPIITAHVAKGGTLSEGMIQFKKLYPKMVIRMVEVGEKSGGLEHSLFYLADYYENEVDTSTKSLSTAIEPILLIVIGLAVAFLALSIITPIYQITGNVRR